MLNGYEIVLILALALIFFGAKKLPELARGLGHGIREFKKATREVTSEFQEVSNELERSHHIDYHTPEPYTPPPPPEPSAVAETSSSDADLEAKTEPQNPAPPPPATPAI